MTIIIETPQPPVRERLMCVPEGTIVGGDAEVRDATPEDLARAGYVPSVGYLPRREVETAVSDAMDLQRRLDRMTEVAGQSLAHAARAERAERERNTLRAEVARIAQALGTVHEAEGHAPYPGTAAEMISEIQSRGAETQRLAAELARLTAPAEGEPSGAGLRALVDLEGPRIGVDAALLAVWRDGVAHERARQQQDRATDEELERAYSDAYARACGLDLRGDRTRLAGLLAVAARVRAERCLVAQAVALKVGVSFWHSDAGYAVQVSGRTVSRLKDADVPATLDRLLGEVSRG